MDLFLASKDAKRDGCAWGLRGDEAGSEDGGVEGEGREGAGVRSVQSFCSSFISSFVEVMVMDWKVVR